MISPVSGSKYDEQSSPAASKAEMTSRREITFDMAAEHLMKDTKTAAL
jgi:hypothetical protein